MNTETKLPLTRESHIANCKEVARHYFDNAQMLVSYVRAVRPSERSIQATHEQYKEIRTFLELTGGRLSARASAVLLSMPGFVLDAEGEPPDSCPEDQEKSLRIYQTIRQRWLSRRSPIIGVVVAARLDYGVSDSQIAALGKKGMFDKGDVSCVGWSLCRGEQDIGYSREKRRDIVRKPDEFNRYIGIQKALRRAIPFDRVKSSEIIRAIRDDETIKLREVDNDDALKRVANTLWRGIDRMIIRAEAFYTRM